ncbi:MAG: hypothetical protein ABIW38_01595 [Ferruginibacter sp.]
MRKLTKRDKEAIQSLKSQVEKESVIIRLSYSAWEIQCKSLIKEYLGHESDEYKWFSKKQYAHYSIDGIASPDNTIEKIKDIKNHLIAAIETIKLKGVFKNKSEQKNIFSDYSNAQIVLGAIAIFISGMVSMRILYEIIKSEKSIPTPTNNIPNKIPDANTYSSKDTLIYKHRITDSSK